MEPSVRQKGDFFIPARHHNKSISYDITFINNDKPKPIVIFVHGFKGFKDWGHFNLIARFFAEREFFFIKPNLSHNGTSVNHPEYFEDLSAFASNNFLIELDDMDSILDLIYYPNEDLNNYNDEFDPSVIYLVGHSRGGSISILKAYEDERVSGVTTWAAVDDLISWVQKFENPETWKQNKMTYIYNSRTEQRMPLYYQLYETTMQNQERLNIASAVSKLQKPFLAIHGSEDEAVSPQTIDHFKEWNPNAETVLLEGANHTFGGYHPYEPETLPEHTLKVCDRTTKFFERMVASH